MKYTLLELTQAVLRSIKGEQVDSISDTEESLAVADLIKECYYTILSDQDFPETKTLYELNASGDVDQPVLMTVPDGAYTVEWLKYNVRQQGESDPVWRELKYLPLKDFVEYTMQFSTDEDNVNSMRYNEGTSTLDFKYKTDAGPTYYTTFNDSVILFDSYDSEVDTTLQKTKTMAYGMISTWSQEDDFTPNLDAQQFTILLKEAKMLAWQEFKSQDNQTAMRQSRNAKISAEAKKNRVNNKNTGYYYNLYPNYGRK